MQIFGFQKLRKEKILDTIKYLFENEFYLGVRDFFLLNSGMLLLVHKGTWNKYKQL